MTGASGTAPTNSATGPDWLSGFLNKLLHVESNGDYMAKAKTSTASGGFQFTKSTWINLGGQWGPDDSKPFGGLAPSVEEQNSRAALLTSQNANTLAKLGTAINDVSLYAAHFLGPSKAAAVLNHQGNAVLASLVGASVVAANPFLAHMTVSDFIGWLQGKVGA